MKSDKVLTEHIYILEEKGISYINLLEGDIGGVSHPVRSNNNN